MSIYELTRFSKWIENDKHDVIILTCELWYVAIWDDGTKINKLEATDECLGKVVKRFLEKMIVALITADHRVMWSELTADAVLWQLIQN